MMLAALVRFLIRLIPWLSYDHRRRRRVAIPRKQTCKACGNRVKVDMRYDPGQKQVVCGCPICFAMWAYDPIVKAEKFAKPITEE